MHQSPGKRPRPEEGPVLPSTVSPVLITSLTPPALARDASLHAYLTFIEKYQLYATQGGHVEMRNCVDQSFLQDLLNKELFNPYNPLELQAAFYRHYCPRHVNVTLALLNAEKCPRCDSIDTFSMSRYMQYVRRFHMIMSICQQRRPSTRDCIKLLIRNTQPPELSNHLQQLSVADSSYETMVPRIAQECEEVEACTKFMKTIRSDKPKVHSAGGGAGGANHQQRSKPPMVNIVQSSTGPADTPATETPVQPKRTWSRDMCLGCGHVTNPPHRRRNCPYRECQGWCAKGVPSAPIRLPTVAMLTDEDDNVCIVHGQVSVANNPNSIAADIGLDSMSAISIISPSMSQRLMDTCQARLKHLRSMKYVQPAGFPNPVGYNAEVELTVTLPPSASFTSTFVVMPIPVDMLVCWADIKAHKLFGILAEAAGVSLPKLTEIASEDNWSDDHVEVESAVPVEREALQNQIIKEFPTVFNEDLPGEPAKVPPFIIELRNPQVLPESGQPRRQPLVIRKFISDTVDDLLKSGFIVPSTSPVASPVVVVRAPGKDPRMCVDYRVVNAATLPLCHPLPNLKDILSRLRGFKYFCKLDLRKGYHQAVVDPASRYLTAFVTEQGQFEYVRVPFGLRNAPAYFQHVVSKHVLAGLVGSICDVYIDDVITGGHSIEELLDNIRLILKRFADHGMIVHPRKWIFGVDHVEFLGHVVSSEGIAMSEAKMQGLVDLQPPKDKTTLKSFIGLANYFRDFVPNVSSRIATLTAMASPKAPFVWDDKMHEQYEDIRQSILHAPMLYHIYYALPLVLRTDVSQFGVGGKLLQLCNGVEQPVSFVSKMQVLKHVVGLRLIKKHLQSTSRSLH
jgi:hypothetical protein